MSWYRISQKQLVLWHATTPDLGELIVESCSLRPSADLERETGENYAGWHFMQQGHPYGAGVYLADDAQLAISYAMKRLRRQWEEAEDIEQLLLDEERYGFIGLFKINVLAPSKLVAVKGEYGTISHGEHMFLGDIPCKPNQFAWFEGPEWIDVTAELSSYVQHLEKVHQELMESLRENHTPEPGQPEDSSQQPERAA